MRTPPSKTWVEVSRSAIVANARTLKTAAKGAKLMAVVKSNAYGHGLTDTVRAVVGAADWFGVDSVDEADEVSRVSKGKPVLILGYVRDADKQRAVKAGHRMVAYDLAAVRRLSRIATPRRPARIHVKVETGTSRQGADIARLPALLKAIAKLPNVRVEGASTHYANIEDTADPSYAMRQLDRFRKALKEFDRAGLAPEVRHTACSAAVFLYPDTHFDLVRGGISLYGLWSSEQTRDAAERHGEVPRLRPALSWKTIIAQVKDIPAGTPVSYGLTETVPRDARVAVLPVGYWDGYDRALSSKAEVLIRGRRAKVLGRVCMNMCVVDVTDIPGVRPEDEVTLIGAQGGDRITAEELAARAETINYEIVTRINPRIPRISVR